MISDFLQPVFVVAKRVPAVTVSEARWMVRGREFRVRAERGNALGPPF